MPSRNLFFTSEGNLRGRRSRLEPFNRLHQHDGVGTDDILGLYFIATDFKRSHEICDNDFFMYVILPVLVCSMEKVAFQLEVDDGINRLNLLEVKKTLTWNTTSDQ